MPVVFLFSLATFFRWGSWQDLLLRTDEVPLLEVLAAPAALRPSLTLLLAAPPPFFFFSTDLRFFASARLSQSGFFPRHFVSRGSRGVLLVEEATVGCEPAPCSSFRDDGEDTNLDGCVVASCRSAAIIIGCQSARRLWQRKQRRAFDDTSFSPSQTSHSHTPSMPAAFSAASPASALGPLPTPAASLLARFFRRGFDAQNDRGVRASVALPRFRSKRSDRFKTFPLYAPALPCAELA
mmetsp:Transcript_10080/g.19714  ORF Transcript_10080/g.19714 Transcript_10080/m.19714 type:complete len:238 (-) Transcript_10080:451-1164(-)